MTTADIAKAFSNGVFDKTNDHIADDAIWEVVEENTFVGKKTIIENCNLLAAYFKLVTTHFKTRHVISEKMVRQSLKGMANVCRLFLHAMYMSLTRTIKFKA